MEDEKCVERERDGSKVGGGGGGGWDIGIISHFFLCMIVCMC